MSSSDPQDLLRRFAPPVASETLRGRVMDGAREAAARAIRPSRVDRIWYSRSWRLAWVGALGALILLEVFSTRVSHGVGGSGAARPVVVSESAVAAKTLGLPARPYLGDRVATSGNRPVIAVAEAL